MKRRFSHRSTCIVATALLALTLGMAIACSLGGGDEDGDGLLDEWETGGLTIDPDGVGPIGPQFVDLPAMGADPHQPDIFLQIDWMADASHSHALARAAIAKVVQAFADSPYRSPTGSVGINLHVDQGPSSILDFTTGATWGALSRAQQLAHVDVLGRADSFGYGWKAFQAIKDAHFTPTGRTPAFHYGVAAHSYDSKPYGSSGVSRGAPGSDLIISLGALPTGVGTINEQAGTLMHELGHNLGLHHGGGDDTNYKPNYLSVMNYSYQLTGFTRDGEAATFDYSRSEPGSRTESSPGEPTGAGQPGVATEISVPFDLNGDHRGGAGNGYNDWVNLTFRGGSIGQAVALPRLS